ncbi:hypothetical protein EON64_10220 [archaeon]|nr:MAG: hypothetical protein EON64_10220 [archaeon]
MTSEEAVQLLITLGCVPDLKQRIGLLGLTGVVDGEALSEFDDFDTLQELEQDVSPVRRSKLKTVFKRLQICQLEGVSQVLLKDVRAKLIEVSRGCQEYVCYEHFV